MRFAMFAAFLLVVAPVLAAETTGSATRYEIRDGGVVIPEWDNSRPASRDEMRLSPFDFEKPVNIYNNQLIFQEGVVRTRAVDVPATATEFFLYGRAAAEEDIFPRIRVSFENSAPNAKKVILFVGHVQSRATDYLVAPLPPESRGARGRFVLEFLNPSRLNDWRSLWIAFAGIQ